MSYEQTATERFGVSAPLVALVDNGHTVVTGKIETSQATRVVTDLLYLDADKPGSPVTIDIIDSPGGSVSAGFAILDTARRMKGTVSTIGYGMCASMAAVLLVCAGTPGNRYATENTTIMLHQPSGMASGQSTDVTITANWLLRTRSSLEGLIASASGLSPEKVHDICERDTFLTAYEAQELGLIDHVIESR